MPLNKKEKARLRTLVRKESNGILPEELKNEKALLIEQANKERVPEVGVTPAPEAKPAEVKAEAPKEVAKDKPGETKIPKGMQLVDSAKLDAILDTVEDQNKKIERLQDKAGITDQPKAKAKPRVHLKAILDQDSKEHLIIGWKSSPDNRLVYSPSNPNVVVGEVLQAEYTDLNDWKSGWIDQVRFTRSTLLYYAEVVSQEGNIMTLQFEPEGQKFMREAFQIDVAFVNP